jgi:lysophospholipase L1-like esterase
VLKCSSPFDLITFYPYGDSKTAGGGDTTPPPADRNGFPPVLEALGNFREAPWRLGIGGMTTADMAARVASDIAGFVQSPNFVLLNVGVNDIGTLPAEATWKADYATALDAFNAKWPTIKVLCARPWKQNGMTDANTLAVWISDLIATRSWCSLGIDERVFLEGGDNGATYTSDGTHPTHAGYALTAAQWKLAIGL